MGKWDDVWQYLIDAKKEEFIEDRLILIEKGIKLAKEYKLEEDSIEDMETWKGHIELLLLDTPKNDWKTHAHYEESQKGCGKTSGGYIRGVYREAYKNRITKLKEMEKCVKEGLSVEERLRIIETMKVTLNASWRKNPDYSLKTLEEMEQVEKNLSLLNSKTPMKEILETYVNSKSYISKIYKVACEEYLEKLRVPEPVTSSDPPKTELSSEPPKTELYSDLPNSIVVISEPPKTEISSELSEPKIDPSEKLITLLEQLVLKYN